MRDGILALSLAAAVAAANPAVPQFLTEVGSDSIRGQWVEVTGDWVYEDLRGWRITTGESSFELDCSLGLGQHLAVDSGLLARDDSAHGTFRFNQTGDTIRLASPYPELLIFPSLPAGPACAPSFVPGSSASCWGRGHNCCWYVDSTPTPGQYNDDCGAISGLLVGVPDSLDLSAFAFASGSSARVDVDVDRRTGAFYLGGLSPGKYRVTVHACLSGGVWTGAAADSIELGYAESRTGVVVYFSWGACQSLPRGNRGKLVKDGACLASLDSSVYALKGNRTCEFYHYDMRSSGWHAVTPIPAVGRLGQNKPVSKGATLCAVQSKLYATKGCGSSEFWEFTPDTGQGAWVQLADVPPGSRQLGPGASSTALTFDGTAWVYLLRGAGTGELYRYNPLTDSWSQQTGPPLTPSGKAFGRGSAMTSDGGHTLYVLKGRTNEFYNYDLLTGTWSSLPDLPLVGLSQHQRRAGNGAGLAYIAADSTHSTANVYVLKGGNTLESWSYAVGQPSWTQMEDLPLGHRKKVGAGGAITASERMLYALKGSKTLDFYSHPPDPIDAPVEVRATGPSAEVSAVHLSVAPAFVVAPNPASSFVNVRLGVNLNTDTRSTVRVCDAAGRVVLDMPVVLDRGEQSRSQRVDISALPDGCYFVAVEPAGRGRVRKIIKTGERK